MAIIKKKCWPEFFKKFCSGERTFELRLADFDLKDGDILFFEEDYVAKEQKVRIAPQTIVEIEVLLSYFERAKEEGSVNPSNFMVLEKEYQKTRGELVRSLSEVPRLHAPAVKAQAPVAVFQKPGGEKKLPSLSERQKKIIEILRNKEKTQVWELQKVLPEVTKRTLRRDLDDLLQLKLISRQGEWNTVFYTMK